MALPELLMPASLPYFKAADHVRTPDSVYAGIERQSGFARRRRVFTSAPQMLETMLEVTQAQLEEFYAWHEGPLKAGAEPFTAYVSAGALAIQYWEAYILEFKAEHKEGNLHDISLKIRLKGNPSAVPPTPSSLTAEAAVPLLWTFDFAIGTGLSAEVLTALTFDGGTGASFSAEALLDLQTEFGGVLAYSALSAEVLTSLEFYGIVLPSEALAAEVICGLDFVEQLGVALSAEVAVGLDAGIAFNVGFINAPTFTETVVGAPQGLPAQVGLFITASGTVYTLDAKEFLLSDKGTFHVPPTPGVASNKWIKVDLIGGAGGFVADAGPWGPFPSPLNTPLILGLENPPFGLPLYEFLGPFFYCALRIGWEDLGSVSYTATLRVRIANDPDIYDVVSTFDVTLNLS